MFIKSFGETEQRERTKAVARAFFIPHNNGLSATHNTYVSQYPIMDVYEVSEAKHLQYNFADFWFGLVFNWFICHCFS